MINIFNIGYNMIDGIFSKSRNHIYFRIVDVILSNRKTFFFFPFFILSQFHSIIFLVFLTGCILNQCFWLCCRYILMILHKMNFKKKKSLMCHWVKLCGFYDVFTHNRILAHFFWYFSIEKKNCFRLKNQSANITTPTICPSPFVPT